MSSKFHELTVSAVKQETEDAVSVSFDVPPELQETFNFVPGQYLTLRAMINGQDVRRSYSICAGQGDGLRVGIKRVENGSFSTFAQALAPNTKLEVMPPEGRFVCKCDPVAQRNILLIAAGSGITPVLSIAKSILKSEAGSVVTLVYGNRSTASIMFREELEDLKDSHMENFHVYHVLSREAQDVDLFSGRISVERIAAMTEKGLISPSDASAIYVCGPSELSLELTEHLEKNGVDRTKIFTELFEAPGEKTPVIVSKEAKRAAEEGVEVEVILDGVRRKFMLQDAADTVLAAAEKSGLDLPFSCAGGMCATCRCKLVEGNARMDRNYSLDTWEVDAGFVLACQLRPETEKLVLDFDAA